MSALLTVEGVTRHYPLPRQRWFGPAPRFTAVDGVSFTIAEGECLAIVGESGCGKSTLARQIAGLEPLDDGTLRWSPAPADRVPVQMVFQDPFGSFNPRRRIGWSLLEPLHRSNLSREERITRMQETLRSVGLSTEAVDRYPHQFSGGQRQRLALARALMPAPRLLIADEPTSALDLSIQAQILILLTELRARHGLSILFVSHNLSAVRAIASRVMVMAAGRFVETGPVATLLTTPTHPLTRRLLDAELFLPSSSKIPSV